MNPLYDRREVLPLIFSGAGVELLDKFEFLSTVEEVDIYIDREDNDDYLLVYVNTGAEFDYMWMIFQKMGDTENYPDYLQEKKHLLLHEIGTRRDAVVDFISTHYKLLQ